MKKKIVLIAFYDRINLSIRTLSSILRKDGHSVTLIFFKDDRTSVVSDFKKNNLYYQYIFNGNFIGCGEDVNPPTDREFELLTDQVVSVEPDLICLSVRTIAFDLSRRIVNRLRRRLPQSTYIAGGYGPTIQPEKFLQVFDFVCLGEGEEFILKIADSDSKGDIPNVAYSDKDGRTLNNNLAIPIDLDELTFPDWDKEHKYLIEDERIVPMATAYDTKTYDVFASRGCPSNCTYCMANQWTTMYKRYNCTFPKVRLRTPSSVIDELTQAKHKFNINYVRFMDAIFGFNKKWLLEFLDLYDKVIGAEFFCNLDVRYTDKEIIQRLKFSRIKNSTIGIQAVNPTIREKIMGRRISNQRIIDYAWMLHDSGIKYQYDIIHWNPFDSEETLSSGVDFLYKLPQGERIILFQLQFFPGSKIYDRYCELNPSYLSSKDYEFWAWIFIMILKGGYEEIINLAMHDKSFRINPRLLQSLYNNQAQNNSMSKTVIAARGNIDKGDIITTVKLDYVESNHDNGILFDDRFKLVNHIAKRNIQKGEIMKWDDFFSSYGNK